MKRLTFFSMALSGFLCLLGQLEPAFAEIKGLGNVSPTNPLTWDSSTTSYVAENDAGTLTVDTGSKLYSRNNQIGLNANAVGAVTVDGVGSTWNNGEYLYVGHYGNGTLTIRNGASVRVGWTTYVASEAGGEGRIVLGNGTLTTDSLCASPGDLAGTGTIYTRGLVSDVAMVLDSAESLHQTFTFDGESEQNVTLDVNLTNPSSVRCLGAGWKGNGSLTIQNGRTITSREAYLGYHAGSTGVATVDGNNTVWNSDYAVYVGYYGSGVLNITGGGTVVNKDYYGEIGYAAGSSGTVTVSGAGSKWLNNDVYGLHVGQYGNGVLEIADGGYVEVDGFTEVGAMPGSTGLIRLGSGGTFATKSLGASPAQLQGTGTITTRGLTSDVDLVLDSTASLQQTFLFNSLPDQNITVRMDMRNTNDIGDLGAGWQGHGSLTIRSGIKVSGDVGLIGQCPGSAGTATISGVGTKWTSRSGLYVGFGGNGSMTIADGGSVENAMNAWIGDLAGAVGKATVKSGGTWTSGASVIIGGWGHATLEILDKGIVASSYGSLGYKAGSLGKVTVSGTGSKWTANSSFYVGEYGNGTLEISDSGAVISGSTIPYAGSIIGLRSGSSGTATVTGVGSNWTNNGLLVGCAGSGTLEIMDGGVVASGGADSSSIGLQTGAIGAVVVAGAGSKWTNSGGLYVGSTGRGTLTITDGGLVSIRRSLTIDSNGGNDSFINMFSGGMLALYGDADDSLFQFLGLVNGTDAIRYWDDSIINWAPLTGATPGTDFTLNYITDTSSSLNGYTLLTVRAVPEPGSLALLSGIAVIGVMYLRWRRV